MRSNDLKPSSKMCHKLSTQRRHPKIHAANPRSIKIKRFKAWLTKSDKTILEGNNCWKSKSKSSRDLKSNSTRRWARRWPSRQISLQMKIKRVYVSTLWTITRRSGEAHNWKRLRIKIKLSNRATCHHDTLLLLTMIRRQVPFSNSHREQTSQS